LFYLQPSTVSQTVETYPEIRKQAVWETKSTARRKQETSEGTAYLSNAYLKIREQVNFRGTFLTAPLEIRKGA